MLYHLGDNHKTRPKRVSLVGNQIKVIRQWLVCWNTSTLYLSCIWKSDIFLQGKVICRCLDWFGNFSVYQYPTILPHLQKTGTLLTTLWAAVRHNSLVLLKRSEILQMQCKCKESNLEIKWSSALVHVGVLLYSSPFHKWLYLGLEFALLCMHEGRNWPHFGTPQW